MCTYKIEKLIFIILILSINFGYAQNKLAATYGISAGVSSAFGKNVTYQSWESTPRFSGKIGVNFEYSLGKKSSIRSGVEMHYIGNETNSEALSMNGETDGYTTYDLSKYHLFYTGIPLSYVYKIKNAGINIGVQSLFLNHQKIKSRKRIVISDLSSNLPNSYQLRVLNHTAKTFDFGPQIGLFYRIGKKAMIRADAYFGLSNISHEYNVDRKNRQFTLGLEFDFNKK